MTDAMWAYGFGIVTGLCIGLFLVRAAYVDALTLLRREWVTDEALRMVKDIERESITSVDGEG